MPNRVMLNWCQTPWRTFAQTMTLLPLTRTDGVSRAWCVEGYSSLDAYLCLKLHLDHTGADTNTHTCTETEERGHY